MTAPWRSTSAGWCTCWSRTRSTASASGLSQLDRALLVFARRHGHTPGLERATRTFSRTGEHAACWLGLGVMGAALTRDAARRTQWLRGVRIVAASYAANYLVKVVVHRRRPELADLPPLTPTVSRLSFPSAHATTSFAACRGFRGLVPTAVLYGAAGLFALSRPYLGVHYPSDVLAGAILGTVIGETWPEAPTAPARRDVAR